MKEFEINVEQIFSYTFKVKAENMEQAMKIASEKWNKRDFQADKDDISCDLSSRTMMARDIENDEETNWIDF